MRHRKRCQLLSYLWYHVMASRGEQGCTKALNSPKSMSLGVCAECWPALAEPQAWKLHTALLAYTHSYSDTSRNARAEAMGASALLTRAEPPELLCDVHSLLRRSSLAPQLYNAHAAAGFLWFPREELGQRRSLNICENLGFGNYTFQSESLF